ncbi:MAG: hypothetical protein LBI33_05160 [Propionibacteriaceae bacterium]|jgi:hypothetical protein|nr:hypothetical protein [Propionibacteriaceae bacterium]
MPATNLAGRRFRWVIVVVVLVAVVVGGVIFALSPRWENTSIAWWSSTGPGSSTLTVGVQGGVGEEAKVRVTETADGVRLAGATRLSGHGARPAIMIVYTVEVQLDAPLAGRQVIGEDGNVIPQT